MTRRAQTTGEGRNCLLGGGQTEQKEQKEDGGGRDWCGSCGGGEGTRPDQTRPDPDQT